jgi:hypothetical protein
MPSFQSTSVRRRSLDYRIACENGRLGQRGSSLPIVVPSGYAADPGTRALASGRMRKPAVEGRPLDRAIAIRPRPSAVPDCRSSTIGGTIALGWLGRLSHLLTDLAARSRVWLRAKASLRPLPGPGRARGRVKCRAAEPAQSRPDLLGPCCYERRVSALLRLHGASGLRRSTCRWSPTATLPGDHRPALAGLAHGAAAWSWISRAEHARRG